jgi:hypothetical protein
MGCKLHQRQQFNAVALLRVAEGSEVWFHSLPIPFSLPVSVQKENSHEVVLDTEVRADSASKLNYILIAPISGDIVWYPSYADHTFEQHLYLLCGVNVLLEWR